MENGEKTSECFCCHQAVHEMPTADSVHKKMDEEPVATHFNSAGHLIEDMSVMVIEKLWKDDPVLRKIRENRWISTDCDCIDSKLSSELSTPSFLTMTTSWETHVSPADPTLPSQLHAHSTLQNHDWELYTTYQLLARAQSHHQFISTCLRINAHPRGLHIKIKPCVLGPKHPAKNWQTTSRSGHISSIGRPYLS